jgi:N6-L-threonylcarbamoyladenine synthase
LRKISSILKSESLTLLGIETSCDDSSMSVMRDGKVLSNLIYSQAIHKKYGGVIPEWASRKHLEAMVPLYRECLHTAGVGQDELSGIAVTRGPGLMGSLLVGMGFAKALSFSLGIPLVEVNHLEAHIFSVMIESSDLKFPYLCLTVSGGHTQLIRVDGFGRYSVLGTTLDDAAGEAFDKTGKMLGLEYPAGPEIDRLAAGGKPVHRFPVSEMDGFDYSFSGFKTSVLYYLEKNLRDDPDFIRNNLHDLCASIQGTIVEILIRKVRFAMRSQNLFQLGVAGGVSANSGLRKALMELSATEGWTVHFPSMQYCTDNAAMIAFVGYKKFQERSFADEHIVPLAKYPIKS